MATATKRYVISALVSDHVGIMHGITATITDLEGDIEDISQTVLQGCFTVVLIAAFKTKITADKVRDAITAAFRHGEASVLVREYREPRSAPPRGSRYIITLMGREAPGILKALTAYLAEKNINIEDWFFRVDGETVTHVGEITVPPRLDMGQVQDDLRALLEPRNLRVHCRHENLFRAANEVTSVRLMLGSESGTQPIAY